MSRSAALIVVVLVSAAAGFFFRGYLDAPVPVAQDPVRHRTLNTPTIEQVQKLASLVALRVPISDLTSSQMSGLTGGVETFIAVHGDVDIAADLSTAKFEQVDAEKHTAILVLRKPEPQRPRLDHEKTRILSIQRSGLWRLNSGGAADVELTNLAMQSAQRVLGEVAARQDLAKQACQQTDHVIHDFFAATGWQVTVQWDETPAPPASAAMDGTK